MANYAGVAALKRRLGLGPLEPEAPAPIAFTDNDWRTEQRLREAVDALVHPYRWRVTVLPVDHCKRTFYLRGVYQAVVERANQIFPHPCLVLIEPAPVQGGGEVYDCRLSLST